MTTKAIEARNELQAWLAKYQPKIDYDNSGCYYPDDRGKIQVAIDDAIIAVVTDYSIDIQS